jgi:hypothetical protein
VISESDTQEISPALADWQVKAEKPRPVRMPLEAFTSMV